MTMLRQARSSDKAEFRMLWDMCFTDSENFRNWFFENRYIPAYSVCMEEDGKIVFYMSLQNINHTKSSGSISNFKDTEKSVNIKIPYTKEYNRVVTIIQKRDKLLSAIH